MKCPEGRRWVYVYPGRGEEAKGAFPAPGYRTTIYFDTQQDSSDDRHGMAVALDHPLHLKLMEVLGWMEAQGAGAYYELTGDEFEAITEGVEHETTEEHHEG